MISLKFNCCAFNCDHVAIYVSQIWHWHICLNSIAFVIASTQHCNRCLNCDRCRHISVVSGININNVTFTISCKVVFELWLWLFEWFLSIGTHGRFILTGFWLWLVCMGSGNMWQTLIAVRVNVTLRCSMHSNTANWYISIFSIHYFFLFHFLYLRSYQFLKNLWN
jgi:hypothetical protein